MAQTYNKLKIDIKEPITDIITAKQNDSNSRFLDVYLYDGGVPIDLTGHEVRIYMLKADGTEVFNNGEITNAAAGRCQFELTDQALGAYGKLLCEISIWYDNVQILTSQTFGIDVVKNLRTDGSIESSNEYGALVVLYQNLYEAFDLITTMVEQFGEPGEIADEASIKTFWQMLEYLYIVNNNALANSSTQGVLDLIGSTGDTGGSATAGTLMAKANAVIGYLLNGTYGLSALKTLIDSIPKNWYAKYGTTTVIASKTTESKNESQTQSSIDLLTLDVPEDGMYQFSINGITAGCASTSGAYDNSANASGGYRTILLKRIGYRFDEDGEKYVNNQEADLIASTNYATATNKSGYVYLNKGERVTLRIKSGSYNAQDGFYYWIKVASVYFKCIKQVS